MNRKHAVFTNSLDKKTQPVPDWSRPYIPLSYEYTFINILNTLRPRQNGCHFADDVFKCIFLNENI